MSRRLPGWTAAMLLACAMYLCSCSVGPVAGTETGNPDITACLSSALSLFDSADAWLPSTYLVDGERQLNPDNVYSVPSVQHIAKRAASDSTGSAAGSGVGLFDTVFVIDTLFRHDTITLDTVVVDTIDDVLESELSVNRLIIQRVRYDTVFVVDTEVVRDTFLVQRGDAAFAGALGDSRGSMEIDLTERADFAAESYSVTRDSLTGAVILTVERQATEQTAQPVPALEVRSDSMLQMIARKVTIGGVAVSETYRDADGDGSLNAAPAGAAALLTCSCLYSSASTTVDLAVDFDAGADRIFTTTADNRIQSLIRKLTGVGGVADQVRYGTRFFGESGDTVILLRERNLAADSTERIVNRYVCRTGIDPMDHRLNGLIYCQQTAVYRSGALREMELTVTPRVVLAAGKAPEAGTLTANIDFGKGLTGRIDAVVDYLTGIVSGTYAQAGIEYSLFYRRGDKTPTIQPLP